jgi:hypothetical protein
VPFAITAVSMREEVKYKNKIKPLSCIVII